MNYIYMLIIYILIVNLITSYRLVSDDFYNKTQKTVQLSIIWLLPLIGAGIIAWFLSESDSELVGIWKKYPKTSTLLGKFFFIRVKKNNNNDNSYNNHMDGTHCDTGGGD